jgi:hypothetical protein
MIRDRIADAGMAAIAADILAWACNHHTLTGRLYRMIRRLLARRATIEEVI